MTQTIEQLQAKVAELEEENAWLRAESRDACLGLNDYYGRKLAAEQLNNKRLREALEFLNARIVSMDLGGVVERALSLSASTEALAALKAENESLKRDAERWRLLRKTMEESVGGGVLVNDAKLVYEDPEAGEAVSIYWYPDTPVGFYESKADTLDEAIDAMAQGEQG